MEKLIEVIKQISVLQWCLIVFCSEANLKSLVIWRDRIENKDKLIELLEGK